MRGAFIWLCLWLLLNSPAVAQQPTPTPTPQVKECQIEAVSGKEVDRKLRILAKPEPNFTDIEKQMFYHREILLRAVFCGSGKVTDLVVTVGVNDALNEKAKAAAHRIKFSPAEKDGRQVSSVLVVKYVVR